MSSFKFDFADADVTESVTSIKDKKLAFAEVYAEGLSYKPEPYQKPLHDERHLNIAHLVEENKELKEDMNFFVCSICTMVIKDPQECGSCNSTYCRECITPWHTSNKTCPKKCKGNQEVEIKELNRFVHKTLKNLKFSCPKEVCGTVLKYEEALKHLETCDHQLMPCKQGCGLGVFGKDMEYHCITQCPNLKFRCDTCEEVLHGDVDTHDCFATLKANLKKERQEVANLKKMLQDLSTIAAGAIDDAPERDVTCEEGHQMSKTRGAVANYEGNPRCDTCGTSNLHDADHFYHCGDCGFDICETCSRHFD